MNQERHQSRRSANGWVLGSLGALFLALGACGGTPGKTSTEGGSATTEAASESPTDTDSATDTATGTETATGMDTATATDTTSDTASEPGEPGFNADNPGAQECGEAYAQDPVTIFTATIDGDSLALSLGYSGGCETHLFGLCWDGAFAKSEPVQVDLVVGHDSQGDLCKAGITEDRSFDLTPLKTVWIDAYGGGGGTIIIHLAGHGEPLTYTF